MKKISYSAWHKYLTCPAMYNNYYNSKLKQSGSTSALVFGSAVDEAFSAALLKTEDPLKVFKDNFTFEMCQDLSWHKYDYDELLFSQEQLDKFRAESRSYEYMCWASMRIKGRLMIEAHETEVMPLIKEVHGVQCETRERPGFIDARLSLKGNDNIPVDYKSTSRPYERDSVKGSVQLALYAKDSGKTEAAYVTFNKRINHNTVKSCKKCGFQSEPRKSHTSCYATVGSTRCKGSWDISTSPEVSVQVIIDTISPEQFKIVDESLFETERAIKAGHFPKNLLSCDKMFGTRCPYYDYCRGGSLKGLEEKSDKR